MRLAKLEILNLLVLGNLQQVLVFISQGLKSFISSFDFLVEVFKSDHINYVRAKLFPLQKPIFVHVYLLE